MPPDIAHYEGREQAYVKHRFLAHYIESLVFKIASRRDVVYVDGFSGPWEDRGERFEDTSFGIALQALRKAKETWAGMGRGQRTMTALLVEKNADAHARLQEIIPRYPDIRIRTFNADFVSVVPDLVAAIPADAFAFVLMDPKGWKIDMEALAPLLRHPNSEVVFNFMFTMINWAASMPSPAIQASLEALMPSTDWKVRLDAIRVFPGETKADARKRVLVSSINSAIARIGSYPYVMETPVLFPDKERTYYSLIYATRSTKGVEVFRDCQEAALKTQDRVRADLRSAKRAEATGTMDLFAPVAEKNDFAARWTTEQEAAARRAIVDAVPLSPNSIAYGELWPRILAEHGVRKVRLGRMVAEMKATGELTFLDWGQRKQVPDDGYRLTR
ncbi:three-Cys-motif partner protein TcmP [Sphingomonas pruni]|uniref:three-Cys-motif partner protein TcmP n=1 Tax=Sphingomonas pruni TaxID=40683 RepID=UPI000835C4C6|nr:three-Cys-motif partner protein TcmP [Sphingomonas pruni]